jgi:hypothetical protein
MKLPLELGGSSASMAISSIASINGSQLLGSMQCDMKPTALTGLGYDLHMGDFSSRRTLAVYVLWSTVLRAHIRTFQQNITSTQ